MKVIYRVDNSSKKNTSHLLTPGREYIVLGMKFDQRAGIKILIQGEKDKLIVSDLYGFEVITDQIPAHWEFYIKDNGEIRVMPKAWMNDTVLNDLISGENNTIELIKHEYGIACKEEGYHQ